MAPLDTTRACWKDPTLVKYFLDLCHDQKNILGKKVGGGGGGGGGSLHIESWDKISKSFEETKNIKFTQKQLKNQWNYLKQKYTVWSNLIGKSGHGYNPVTNTIDWTSEEWEEYIKV